MKAPPPARTKRLVIAGHTSAGVTGSTLPEARQGLQAAGVDAIFLAGGVSVAGIAGDLV